MNLGNNRLQLEMYILEVKNLSKAFGNRRVFHRLSFSLKQGEVMVVCGPSGSGKTTLLRCLNFLELADTGEIYVKDELLWSSKQATPTEAELQGKRRHFGMVFQQYHLFPQYTVAENISLAPRLLGHGSTTAIEARTQKLISELQLSAHQGNYPHELSGGQQQRVAIARALALEPDILCLDEPTSALDEALISTVVRQIKELQAKGQTLLVITHDRSFAEDIADHMLELS